MAAALVQRLPPGKVEDMRVRLCSRLSPFPPYRRRPASSTGRVQGYLGLEPTRPPQHCLGPRASARHTAAPAAHKAAAVAARCIARNAAAGPARGPPAARRPRVREIDT
jgi:hypothetical protein